MSKILRNLAVALLSRSVYVVLGAVLMLIFCRSLVLVPNPNNEFIVPDLRQANECISYKLPDEALIGQICNLDNGYVYVYLPTEQYAEHLNIACMIILDKMMEEGDPQKYRENCFSGG